MAVNKLVDGRIIRDHLKVQQIYQVSTDATVSSHVTPHKSPYGAVTPPVGPGTGGAPVMLNSLSNDPNLLKKIKN
jgi:hypothetical protein